VDLAQPDLLVEDPLRLGVEGGEGAHGGNQHPHRVGIVAEAVHELLHVLVEERVVGDLVHPLVVLGPGGELSEEDQVGGLQVGALLRELLDRVPPVFEDPLVAVDVGDLALARGGVEERGVVAQQPEIARRDLDLP